jgi:hypothetical protein
MKRLKSHLSYANVMSSIAVFLLLGGATALAAKKNTQKVGTTQLKASAVTTNKIKNGAVANSKLAAGAVSTDKLADGSVVNSKIADGSVTNSKLGADSVTGDKVNEATLGEVPAANSGNPYAFAKVNSNGVVDAANAKGITSPNVSHTPASGVYCISVPAFTPRGGQVVTQAGTTVTDAQFAIGGGEKCSAGAVQVSTWNAAGVATDIAFYVSLYR